MHPILFTIFGFQVHTFGVAMVVAFVLSISLARARASRFGMTKDAVGDMAFWAILAGVLGARLFFIAQEWGYYSANPKELLTLQFQGLTSFGGLLCGMGAAMVWSWRKGIPARNLLDCVAPAFLVGHAVGRVGCLMNGCCFGGVCPTTVWGALHIDGATHYPAQIYDSLMNLGALGLVLGIERRAAFRAGQVTGLVIALHGVARFVYEFWRAGTDAQVKAGQASSTYWNGFPLHITQAQAMAFALVLLGVGIFAFSHRRAPLPTPTTPAAA